MQKSYPTRDSANLSCDAYVIWHFYHGTADFSKDFEKDDLTIVFLFNKKKGTALLLSFTLSWNIFCIEINRS